MLTIAPIPAYGRYSSYTNQKIKATNKQVIPEKTAPTELNYYPQNISFAARPILISEDQKFKCHLAIHSASAACAGTSALMGEGAAVGADTPILWGIQLTMFRALKKILDINTADHLFYIARQLMIGQAVGVKGASMLISWLGIAGEVATGGAAAPVISPAIRSVNATLSGGITEKMGWGYVKSYKNGQMKLKNQAFRTAVYMVGSGLFGHNDSDVLDPTSISDVSAAMDSIPKESLKSCGRIWKFLTQNVHLDRFGFLFTAGLAERLFMRRTKPTMDDVKNALKFSLLNTAIYDLIDYEYGQEISQEAIHTVNKLKMEIENTPEVFKEFTEIQESMFNKLDLDKLSVQDFLDKFKDKRYVYNFAVLSGETSSLLADTWRKRNITKLKKARNKVDRSLKDTFDIGQLINKKLSPTERAQLEKDYNDLIAKAKADLNSKTRGNFALNKVAGYEPTKALLSLVYINPIKTKQTTAPNIMLFYGPSGLGKTMMGSAIAEDSGSKFRSKSLGFINENNVINWIKDRLQEAEKTYLESGRSTIIQLNEFDNFGEKNPEALKEFIELAKDSYAKHHCTFMLTTNNPESINKNILKITNVKIPVGIASENDTIKIVNHYLNNKKLNGFTAQDITNELYKVQPDNAYSNSQIENLINTLPQECSKEEFIAAMQKMKPAINKEHLEKFAKEQANLNMATE